MAGARHVLLCGTFTVTCVFFRIASGPERRARPLSPLSLFSLALAVSNKRRSQATIQTACTAQAETAVLSTLNNLFALVAAASIRCGRSCGSAKGNTRQAGSKCTTFLSHNQASFNSPRASPFCPCSYHFNCLLLLLHSNHLLTRVLLY